METFQAVEAMQAHAEEHRRAGARLALVPTMGALHEGHLALVEEASRRADHITVSIFVNPTQFGPGEDYERYPRTLEADREELRRFSKVQAIFAPTADAMYPGGGGAEANRTWVTVEELGRHLCGRYRPGHFRGVTTVVTKLFLACRPHTAVFGLKDAQQFVILRRLARDLLFGIDVVGVPTSREPDGLARSSRNVYLSDRERSQAVVLSQAVHAAAEAVQGGEQRLRPLVERMRRILAQAPEARVQYAEVVDAETLEAPERLEPGREALAAVAVYFGSTRLIDSAFVRVPNPDSDTRLPDAAAV